MSMRLDPAEHAWMGGAGVARVMDTLNAGADRARFVGGCVRNSILGAAVDDIDIATVVEPEQAAGLLEAAGVKVVPTGLAHGTITAVAEGQPFEVTTLRKDVETFGRRAVVAYTTDWAEDAARRDFRLNAVYARPDGALYDPFGGVEDARAGPIVFIGDPAERIAEDHLRILRFYRFTAWYAASIDPAGQAACTRLAARLKDLSAERIWKELKKLLSAPDPSLAVKAMQEGHVLNAVIAGALDFSLLLSLINRDERKSRAPDPLLRLAALAGRDEGIMTALSEQMKASNAEKAYAAALCAPAPDLDLNPQASSHDLARAVHALGRDAAAGRLRLDEAAGQGDADAALAFVRGFEPPVFPLKGRDLLAAGFDRGPQLGVVLEQLEQDWVNSGFTLDKAALLARAKDAAS